MKLKLLVFSLLITLISNNIFAQGSPNYKGGLKVNINDDGSKYFRIISWAQGQAIYDFSPAENSANTSFKIRRARVLTYAQISDKFLILTHFGLNNLTSNNMSPLGTENSSQLFLHDAWAQYNVHENHSVGIGLHYFNGISRLNNSGTLNMMTLDNNRQSWSTLGLSDQFGRHLGLFAKGSIGKLQYRVSINEAITNGLDNRDLVNDVAAGEAVYNGKKVLGSDEAGFNYAGYFEYHILDEESNFLPFKVGTYLGSKKVFNIGAGFFYHPSGSVIYQEDNLGNSDFIGQDVKLFAVDAFYEAPLLGNNDAITTYLTYQNNNYGHNYLYSAYGSGSMFYGHLGYLIPAKVESVRIQPYSSFGLNTYDASTNTRNKFGLGSNFYFEGHNSKLTIEFMQESFGTSTNQSITLQAMIFI